MMGELLFAGLILYMYFIESATRRMNQKKK